MEKIDLWELSYRLDKIEDRLSEIDPYGDNDIYQEYWEQLEHTRTELEDVIDLLDRYNNNPNININQFLQGFTRIVNQLEHQLNLNKRMQ